MPRILGLDPGSRVTGYGVVDAEGSHLRYVEAGAFAASARDPLERRLARVAAELRAALGRLRPDAAAVEDLFVKLDPRAALAVGQARGALLAVLGEAGIAVHAYPPATVKRVVTGSGRADKQRVGRMVATLLGLPQAPEPADAADALAVAITHALRSRTQALGNS